ncbi:hypothetical protein ABTX81_37875 [Kitasatospora sp. NPDC097605]|uniref:FtsX-like permease family protein n=1 Tax=Kitasatospora sp. NPDC097605 TaxID=3157226 RepID=UPI0033316F9B
MSPTVTVPAALAVAWRAVLSRQARRRVVLLALVGTIAALGVLATVGAAAAKGRENARTGAMVPVFGPQAGFGGAPVFGRPDVPETGWSELEHNYGGQTVKIVRVADPHARGPLPPGITAWPSPGRALVSPALDRLIRSAPASLGQWFSGTDTEVLPARAVGSAGQLIAYLGVAPGELGTQQGPLTGFGGAGGRGFGWYPALGSMLFLVMPAFALVLAASRFGRQVRTTRYQALRLLGLPGVHARLAGALETAAPVAVGALVAGLAWPLLLPDMFALPVTGRWLFGADLRVPAGQSALAVLGVAALAGVLGAATVSGSDRASREVRFLRPVRLTSPWVALLFGAGLLLLAVAYARHKPRDPLLWAAIVLLGAGLPSAAAWAGQRLARVLGRVEAGVVWLLAMRRLGADPQSRFRVAGMVGIAVFAVGAAQPVSQVMAQPNLPWVAQARAAGHTDLLARAETLEAVPLRLTDPPAGVHGPVPAVALWSPGQDPAVRPAHNALVADCRQLQELFARPLSNCAGGRMTLRASGPLSADGEPAGQANGPSDMSGSLLLRSTDRTRQTSVAPVATTLDLPADQDTPVGAVMVLPPDDPALAEVGDPFTIAAYLRVTVDVPAWEEARTWVVSSSPAYRLENSYQLSEVTDSTGSWVLLGLTAAAAVTVLGALLTVAEDGGRRREWFALRALGVPRGRLTAVQLTEALVTAILTSALATLASTAVGVAYLRINEDHLDSGLPYLFAAGAGVAAIVLAAAASSWVTLRRAHR